MKKQKYINVTNKFPAQQVIHVDKLCNIYDFIITFTCFPYFHIFSSSQDSNEIPQIGITFQSGKYTAIIHCQNVLSIEVYDIQNDGL